MAALHYEVIFASNVQPLFYMQPVYYSLLRPFHVSVRTRLKRASGIRLNGVI